MPVPRAALASCVFLCPPQCIPCVSVSLWAGEVGIHEVADSIQDPVQRLFSI